MNEEYDYKNIIKNYPFSHLQPVAYSTSRVPFETSFDEKQTAVEPKLVSALSKTKRLFWLFRFYTKTESFGVSIETEEQPKQFDREHIWWFFQKSLGRFGLFCFFRNSLIRLFRFYTETATFDVSIEPKQTEPQL